MTLAACALVLIGGFFGGISRFFLSGVVGRGVGETFPWGTLAVNISGAFAIGAFAGAARAVGGVFASDLVRDLIVVGLFGGYTTVSSLCLQTLNLALEGEGRLAAFNVVASSVLCVVFVAAGFWAVVWIVG
ncbi:fluoride efflux transporter CrcB [Mesorhizobium sp. M2D.F.Ca.ET.185.01.1.1]|uniref:fluoride efflux transporter CrcB n=2 Tax=Mesorhizobium TaxID=68287 RepID=UPI000FCBA9C3|nr:MULTISPECIES: fluoride efflux transporter CrcB [unclassified Mesorhizobium]TGP57538.1 fluoride efflux transporter CrcB [bacterium M00.F.Ca.ET.230.01.1.1]TGP76983.1 fluoride efflux transporter CrcB [bacterium M00.F.Ca.ET.227.01.1.1]TGU04740.1 fluoride efflux transporter CrcB [bacterium M00.F.Ca.ET.163.01.1.1]TGU30730.1 fluoride efflux transporter CrcB [bacterium M00.F.Ca.ET.156.01.1.1]TGU44987.1 fluoride efflux transporter CrcB [bacterium M00.F.Ca.ET.146.01.1.1]TGV67462.1 fluoride efflux tr